MRCSAVICVVLCTVCVYMCTVLLPPGDNSIAVNKYIIKKHGKTCQSVYLIKVLMAEKTLTDMAFVFSRPHNVYVKYSVLLALGKSSS